MYKKSFYQYRNLPTDERKSAESDGGVVFFSRRRNLVFLLPDLVSRCEFAAQTIWLVDGELERCDEDGDGDGGGDEFHYESAEVRRLFIWESFSCEGQRPTESKGTFNSKIDSLITDGRSWNRGGHTDACPKLQKVFALTEKS